MSKDRPAPPQERIFYKKATVTFETNPDEWICTEHGYLGKPPCPKCPSPAPERMSEERFSRFTASDPDIKELLAEARRARLSEAALKADIKHRIEMGYPVIDRALSDARTRADKLEAEIKALRHNVDAYRGALGYPIHGDHNGLLADGTPPVNGIVAAVAALAGKAEAERDTARSDAVKLQKHRDAWRRYAFENVERPSYWLDGENHDENRRQTSADRLREALETIAVHHDQMRHFGICKLHGEPNALRCVGVDSEIARAALAEGKP